MNIRRNGDWNDSRRENSFHTQNSPEKTRNNCQVAGCGNEATFPTPDGDRYCNQHVLPSDLLESFDFGEGRR
jgi:hypothetical protein